MMPGMVSDVIQTLSGTIGELGTMEMDKMGRDHTRTRCNKSTLLSHIEMWRGCDTNLQILQIFCDKT